MLGIHDWLFPSLIFFGGAGIEESWSSAPYLLFPNFWWILEAIAYLNYTQTLDLGIKKLFHVYALQVVDNWFDL